MTTRLNITVHILCCIYLVMRWRITTLITLILSTSQSTEVGLWLFVCRPVCTRVYVPPPCACITSECIPNCSHCEPFHFTESLKKESMLSMIAAGMGPLLRNVSITNNTHYWEESPITTLIVITDDCKSINFNNSWLIMGRDVSITIDITH